MKAFGWVFALLGVGALVGVVACGATHQLYVAGVCALMTWCSFSTAKRDAKEAATARHE